MSAAVPNHSLPAFFAALFRPAAFPVDVATKVVVGLVCVGVESVLEACLLPGSAKALVARRASVVKERTVGDIVNKFYNGDNSEGATEG